MQIGDLVKMKKGWSPVGLVVDIIKQVDPFGSIRVLWSDDMGKTLEFPETLKLVQ
jgi:hypothetical protein|tara:strand:+ start:158 stop:322 length:165 start_codon:yes stop_codon:yes gene_type:complete